MSSVKILQMLFFANYNGNLFPSLKDKISQNQEKAIFDIFMKQNFRILMFF